MRPDPPRCRTPSGGLTYVSGVVYLDPVAIQEVRLRMGAAAATTVVLHELGTSSVWRTTTPSERAARVLRNVHSVPTLGIFR